MSISFPRLFQSRRGLLELILAVFAKLLAAGRLQILLFRGRPPPDQWHPTGGVLPRPLQRGPLRVRLALVGRFSRHRRASAAAAARVLVRRHRQRHVAALHGREPLHVCRAEVVPAHQMGAQIRQAAVGHAAQLAGRAALVVPVHVVGERAARVERPVARLAARRACRRTEA